MHVVVAMSQQHISKRCKNAGLVTVEVLRENQVQCGLSLRFVLIMPMGIVPATAVGDLISGQAE